MGAIRTDWTYLFDVNVTILHFQSCPQCCFDAKSRAGETLLLRPPDSGVQNGFGKRGKTGNVPTI